MAVILPVSLFAQDTSGAMLHSSSPGILVNQNAAPASTAIFPNDLIQTQKDAIARIEVSGSAADINPETVVQYQSNELVLDHGSLSVNTSRGMRVRVGCITITPVHDNAWTQYEVKDLNGKVAVSALKDDVYIDAHSKNPQEIKKKQESNRTIVHEGEQKSREEKCGGAYIKAENAAPGIGSILNSPYAIWAGTGIVIGMTCYALCRGSEPVSPSCPSGKACSIP